MQKSFSAAAVLFLACLLPLYAPAQDLSDLGAVPVDLAQVSSTTVGKTSSSTAYGSPSTGSFTGVLVDVSTDGDSLLGQIRFVSDKGWSGWYNLRVFGRIGQSGSLSSYTSDNVHGGGFEVRFRATDAHFLTITWAATFDSRTDADRQKVEWSLSDTREVSGSASVRAPQLITRSDWGAEPFRGEPIPLARPSYDRITFHHAACCGAYSYAEGIAQVKWIQEFHQDGRGWSDIGYQFVLDQSGRLYQGRPFMDPGVALADGPTLTQGAHVGGYNRGNIGISVLGCYHPPEGNGCTDVLSPATLDSLIQAIAFLSDRYQVSTNEIYGHRDFSSTACPGDNNYRILPDIRTRVEEVIRFGSLPVVNNFTLSEVFPNPTGSSATVRYFMDTEGIASLTVHDALGRSLKRIDEGFRNEDRWNTVTFDTVDLPPGVYFVRLSVSGFSGTTFTGTQPLIVAR